MKKSKDRFFSPPFLAYVRSLPCCACGRPATASHMVSVKWADGSDALAVPACMPLHHVQSTRVSKAILIRAGIDIDALHQILWWGFMRERGVHLLPKSITQQSFEDILREAELTKAAPTRRKNRKQ